MSDAAATSPGPAAPRSFYFVREVAFLLGISESMVLRRIELGDLEATKIAIAHPPGEAWGIDIEAFHAYYPNLPRLSVAAPLDRRPWWTVPETWEA